MYGLLQAHYSPAAAYCIWSLLRAVCAIAAISLALRGLTGNRRIVLAYLGAHLAAIILGALTDLVLWKIVTGAAGNLQSRQALLMAPIMIFTVISLFQVITLPVEFDASRRAKQQLLSLGLIGQQEGAAVGQVLNAAAMTYVAAMVTSFLELFRLLLMARSFNNRD